MKVIRLRRAYADGKTMTFYERRAWPVKSCDVVRFPTRHGLFVNEARFVWKKASLCLVSKQGIFGTKA